MLHLIIFFHLLRAFRIPRYCLGKLRFGNLIHWFRNVYVLADWSRLLILGIRKQLSINTAQHNIFYTVKVHSKCKTNNNIKLPVVLCCIQYLGIVFSKVRNPIQVCYNKKNHEYKYSGHLLINIFYI